MELALAAGLGLLLGAGLLSIAQLLARNATRKNELRVRDTIGKCFSKSGLEVEVSCVKRKRGLLVFIESEPSKKLRFSYIKEQALVQHVERTTGQSIERIFWRFRMKDKEEEKLTAPVSTDAMLAPCENDFEERKPLSARKSDFEVGEIAWDNFAEHVHQQPAPTITTTQFNRIAGNSV
ncbi:MAG: hypothetical protein ACREV0_13895 [Burkholderiales bacterium]